MSSTAFVAIQSALVAALTAAPALAGGRVYPNRQRQINDGVPTALVVRLPKTTASTEPISTRDWSTAYSIECYARAATGEDPAAAVDALLFDTWERLSNLNPAGLGVSAVTVLPDIDWDYADAEIPVVCATIRVQVQHRTAVATLAPWA